MACFFRSTSRLPAAQPSAAWQANNSVGARSLHYGHMVDNVIGIQAVLADGELLDCRPQGAMQPDRRNGNGAGSDRIGLLTDRMRRLYARNADEIERRFPRVRRNVAGYNINRLGREDLNLADLLVGSEGTLAWFQEIELALQPIPAHKVLGICHFPTFHAGDGVGAAHHRLDPAATELIDRTVLDLAAEIPAFSSSMRSFIRGRRWPCCWWNSPAMTLRNSCETWIASRNSWAISVCLAAC